jgi:uncharacterized phage protein gp47/JayE
MSDVPTRADLFRISRDEILSLNPQLATEVVEEPGSDANILIAGAVAAGDEVLGQVTRLAAGLFLDSAQGAALDRLVFDRYSLTRKPAAPAVGSVNFYLPGAPGSSFVIPAGVVLAGANGAQYVTTGAATFPTNTSGQVGSPLVTAPVRSLLAGSTQQAAIGVIATIVSQNLVQLPNNVTGPLQVTNSVATAGAADPETDNSLRARARNFFSTSRRGTLNAIQQGALAVPGVQTAAVFEATDGSGNPAGMVTLVIADQFTQLLINYSPTGTLLPVNYQAQSQALAQNVESALLDVRAAGIYVDVIVANVQLQAVVLSLTFLAGAQDPDQSAFLARAGVVTYINGLAPGQNFNPAACAAAVFPSVPGLDPTNSQIISPPGIVEPISQTQVFRTTLQLVTAASANTSVTLQ